MEAAARTAVQTAANTVRDLRVAEVVRQDVVIENGQVSAFRVRLGISFKYDSGESSDDGSAGQLSTLRALSADTESSAAAGA